MKKSTTIKTVRAPAPKIAPVAVLIDNATIIDPPSTDVIVAIARKTRLNQWGTETIMYGDKFPKEGTSGRAIWDACVELEITVNSITKLETIIIANLNLKTGKGIAVNPANISIEINSYKKYLKNTSK